MVKAPNPGTVPAGRVSNHDPGKEKSRIRVKDDAPIPYSLTNGGELSTTIGTISTSSINMCEVTASTEIISVSVVAGPLATNSDDCSGVNTAEVGIFPLATVVRNTLIESDGELNVVVPCFRRENNQRTT